LPFKRLCYELHVAHPLSFVEPLVSVKWAVDGSLSFSGRCPDLTCVKPSTATIPLDIPMSENILVPFSFAVWDTNNAQHLIPIGLNRQIFMKFCLDKSHRS
jgi:hypothetical protein